MYHLIGNFGVLALVKFLTAKLEWAETDDTIVSHKNTIPDMSAIRRLLVIGLGNPGAEYRDTFHSAGNIVLESLQRKFPADLSKFESQRHGKKAVLTSIGPKYTLLQSPSVMNISGPWLAKAYKEYLVDNNLTPAEVGLVLVHDDLEEDLGAIKIRPWDRSPRGHNGVKSVHKSLQFEKQNPWARITVGIGRPVSRDPEDVAKFVLGKISKHSKAILEEKGSSALYQALAELETQWEAERAQ